MRLRFAIGNEAWSVHFPEEKITGFKIMAVEVKTEVYYFDFMDNLYNQDSLFRTYQQADKALREYKEAQNNEAKENEDTPF